MLIACGSRGLFYSLCGWLDQHVPVLLCGVVTRTEGMYEATPSSIHSLQFVSGQRVCKGREAFAGRKRVLHPQYGTGYTPPAVSFANEVSELPIDGLLTQRQFEEFLSPSGRLGGFRFVQRLHHRLRTDGDCTPNLTGRQRDYFLAGRALNLGRT